MVEAQQFVVTTNKAETPLHRQSYRSARVQVGHLRPLELPIIACYCNRPGCVARVEMLSLFVCTWETLAAEDNRERHQHGADADHREAGADAAHAGVAGEQAARSEEHRDGDDI